VKLSIILPIYNTDSYLVRCLDSVFHQDVSEEDYELIAINDGSTDNSLAILKDYKNKYKNLVLIDQKNAGDSEARNRGLEIARGTYLTFLDSDDAIEHFSLGTILNKAEKEDLDILYLRMTQYDENGNFLREMPPVGDDNIILPGFEHPRRTFPATLYKRKLTEGFIFDKEILLGTETVLNALSQSRASRCSYISIPYYKYTNRVNSISKQGYTERSYFGYIKGIRNINAFQKEIHPNPTPQQKKYFDAVIIIFMTRIVELSILPEMRKDRFQEIQTVMKSLNLEYILDDMSEKFKFLNSSFFMFSSFQTYLVYKHKVYLFAHNIKKRLKKK
jgi:glycosyltransferase involved in cell wall biosynthesis